ncbi:M56 family metallopeptidase [Foetidibacter luteolus]|uniref:M56 family metallopeptidase n=1 Tax=Foetidibacter luteolus TaxID=2608880 RepID=UPI00129AD5C7|nr:M56 family metallopeptidase [Foetidibacter luteolus]
MQAFLLYLLKSVICCGIMLTYYWLALRNKQFHYYNRFYLLCALMISLTVPALDINWFSFESDSDSAVALMNVLYMQAGMPEVVIKSGSGFAWQDVALTAIVAIGAGMLLLLGVRIARIYRLKSKYPCTKMNEFDFVQTDLQQAPFSFLNNLFWRNDLTLEDSTCQQIMQHEITHIKQKHTWDKLFMEIVLGVCWMNPFFWLMRKELWMIHEFIADEESVKDKDAAAFAAMLLQQQYGSAIFSPAQAFNYSPIKRRLQMLTTSKEPRYSYARRLMALPLLGLVVFLFAFRLHKKETLELKEGFDFYAIADTTKNKAKTDTLSFKSLGSQDSVIEVRMAEVPLEESHDYGTYDGKKITDVFVNGQRTKVILTLDDNSTRQVSFEEAKKQGIKLLQAGTVIVPGDGNVFKIMADTIRINSAENITRRQPLLVVDGEVTEQQIAEIKPDDIAAINVLKGDMAVVKYGDKAEFGVLEITTKEGSSKAKQYTGTGYYEKPDVTAKEIPSVTYTGTAIHSYCVDPKNINETDIEKVSREFADNGYELSIINKGDLLKIVLKSQKAVVNKSYSIRDLQSEGKAVFVTASDNGISVQPAYITISIKPARVTSVAGVNVKDVYTGSRAQAKFPGGQNAWLAYLQKNVKTETPVKNGAPPGTYSVSLAFTVDTDGKLSDIAALNNPGYGTVEEAIRVMKNGPAWQPATLNGKLVNIRQKQVITFKVSK